MLIVIAGPSGVGKDSVLARMRELGKPYHFTVTATTRQQRESERDGTDYIFKTTEQFRRMIDREELLEWAEVYGNLYGVPRSQVAEALSRGHDVIIKTDVQGAATIKRLSTDALIIFLAPPSLDELAQRLTARMTESTEDLSLRLATAESEMGEAESFDYVVVNRQGNLDEAVEEIDRIVAKERHRTPPRRVSLQP
jgi:guanylate kinase